MGLKKRNKVNAEFNMSSLTDIIFLLLIFFMLTSSLVHITVDLPEADARTIASSSVTVSISAEGIYSVNGKETAPAELQSAILSVVSKNIEEGEVPTITIAAERNLPWDYVTTVMKIANNLKARAIIATKPRN